MDGDVFSPRIFSAYPHDSPLLARTAQRAISLLSNLVSHAGHGNLSVPARALPWTVNSCYDHISSVFKLTPRHIFLPWRKATTFPYSLGAMNTLHQILHKLGCSR
ncbi:hypothetical protein I7I50_02785 [Histoplasma capsulatum G186AR]|uniref:Uncharacterized protein n=1 Tax=Ajellomyces capsulatus TaxID=5037 RepID=A0A8H7Z6P3_AJECA|nr:hypothetical protein I7I52_00549 [Histoplasma capsulatum]QSS71797.1 hypothetical protein I7I50_02785 [Histoplasma capsulatum G186AR]